MLRTCFSTYMLKLAATLLIGCQAVENPSSSKKNAPISNSDSKLSAVDCVDPDLSRLGNDQKVMLCDGSMASGTMAACASDGQIDCISDANYKSANISAVASTDILSGVSIAGIAGTVGNCASNGSANCTVSGSFKAATACSGNDSDCYVPTYQSGVQPLRAIDFDAIVPGIVKKNAVIAGVTGDYPSGSSPLANADGTADLTHATFDAQIKDGGTNFEWFDSAGARYVRAGDLNIDADNIKNGISIFTTSGIISSVSASDAWNLRAGFAVGSVTGKLKANCRNGASTTVFGIGAIKSASVANGTDIVTVAGHGYETGDMIVFDYISAPTGVTNFTYYSVIKVDNDSFKVAYSVPNAIALTAIDLTADGSGVVVWTSGQSPKAATASNGANTLTIASHGFSTGDAVRFSATTFPGGLGGAAYYVIYIDANNIRVANSLANAFASSAVDLTSDGSNVYIYRASSGSLGVNDTITDGAFASLPLNTHPWASDDNFCAGIEAADGDEYVWKDVTTTGGGTPSTCATTPANCAMMDKITGLTWSKTQSTSMTWARALHLCKTLDFNNLSSGWRLPTQKEWYEAYNHSMFSAAGNDWISSSDMTTGYFWTSTNRSNYPIWFRAWLFKPSSGSLYDDLKTNSYKVTCVH